jgi:hypothetical protein
MKITIYTKNLTPSCDSRLYGIFCDVDECFQKLSKARDNEAFESVVPYVAHQLEALVVFFCEYTKYPLHDFGQTFAFERFDHQVDMCSHYAEITHQESENTFRALEYFFEHLFNFYAAKDHLPSICSRDYVVHSAVMNHTCLSHNFIYLKYFLRALPEMIFFEKK